MMMVSFRQAILTVFLLGAHLAMSGCAKVPSPVVQDLDSYQTVALGPLNYTTETGLRVVETGPGYVIHEVASAPGSKLQVFIKTDPPRRFRDDANLERRRFQRAVPDGRWTSAQYHEVEGRQSLRINVHGRDKEGEAVFGAMKMVRLEGDTAIVAAIGPMTERHQLQLIVDRLADTLTF